MKSCPGFAQLGVRGRVVTKRPGKAPGAGDASGPGGLGGPGGPGGTRGEDATDATDGTGGADSAGNAEGAHGAPVAASLPRHPGARAVVRGAGFTLLEFMIVLAIAAILAGIAAPGLGRRAASGALAAQATEFMATLRFARSEALKRGTPVTVCAADPSAVVPRCLPRRAADWRAGWLVFMDPGRSSLRAAQEPVLRLQQALQRSGGVLGTRGGLSFTAAGFSTDAASHFLFLPAPTSGGQAPPALLVCVSKQGRPRLAPGASCS